MNKEQFFKAIDGVDDKLLKGVFDADDPGKETALTEAETLRGAAYRPEYHPRRRVFAAAAVCLAVLGAGSFAAVKIMNSQHSPAISDSAVSGGISLGAADSGHSDTIDELISSNSTVNDLPSYGPSIHNLKESYERGDKIEYEGKSYTVITSSIAATGVEGKYIKSYELTLSVRREIIDGVDTVEFAGIFTNNGTTLMGLVSCTESPDEPFLFKLIKDEDYSGHNYDDYDFRYLTHILQPGERYYQTASFPVEEAEYNFLYYYHFTDPDIYDEIKPQEGKRGGAAVNHYRVDLSDKSVNFDDLYELFLGGCYDEDFQADSDNSELSAENTEEPSRDNCYPEDTDNTTEPDLAE